MEFRYSPNNAGYNEAYAVNTHNRHETLSNQTNMGNTYNSQSPRPPSFLGRGMRGHPRGRSRGNRPWRDRSTQPYYPPNTQEWWNPPEWEKSFSLVRYPRTTHKEVVEQDRESSKKRCRGVD